MRYDVEVLYERREKLPEEVRKLVASVTLSNVLKELEEKYKLHIDQLGVIADEINYTLLGLTPAHEFVDKLTKELKGTSSEIIQGVAKDIDEKIFQSIKESLKKLTSEPTLSTTQTTAPELPTTPVTASPQIPLPQPPANLPTGDFAQAKLREVWSSAQEKKAEEEPPRLGGVATASLPEQSSTPNAPVAVPTIPNGETGGASGTEQKKYDADPYREPI